MYGEETTFNVNTNKKNMFFYKYVYEIIFM